MLLRPVDASGDLLPVLASSAMLSGPEAVARLAEYRLSLLRGEWWENPERGFFILDLMQERRVTEVDAASVSSMITAYLRETPGIREVENVRFSVNGRQLLYSCEILTEEGTAALKFEEELG